MVDGNCEPVTTLLVALLYKEPAASISIDLVEYMSVALMIRSLQNPTLVLKAV